MADRVKLNARVIGIESYFDDLQKGKQFYGETLGLGIPHATKPWSSSKSPISPMLYGVSARTES
jgi:hypothetical protein